MTIINGNFETGDLTGWDKTGDGGAEASNTYRIGGQYSLVVICDNGEYATVSQITEKTGNTLTFDYSVQWKSDESSYVGITVQDSSETGTLAEIYFEDDTEGTYYLDITDVDTEEIIIKVVCYAHDVDVVGGIFDNFLLSTEFYEEEEGEPAGEPEFGTTIIYLPDSITTEKNIWGIYFKKKQNQIGRFEFSIAANEADTDIIKKNNYVTIAVRGKYRFDGYITKISKNSSSGIWRVEGEGIGGILKGKTTGLTCYFGSVFMKDPSPAIDYLNTILFYRCGLSKSDWKIVGIPGYPGTRIQFYKLDARSLIDHLNMLAKISGYTWSCYIYAGTYAG